MLSTTPLLLRPPTSYTSPHLRYVFLSEESDVMLLFVNLEDHDFDYVAPNLVNYTLSDKKKYHGDNNCQYCVVAHGAILRIRAKNPMIADQVAINYRKADITDRETAMLDFALKVSRDSRSINEDDRERLRSHGFSDDDIWDIAAITAFFGMSNRLANFLSMRPNDEFYLMGRVPREKA